MMMMMIHFKSQFDGLSMIIVEGFGQTCFDMKCMERKNKGMTWLHDVYPFVFVCDFGVFKIENLVLAWNSAKFLTTLTERSELGNFRNWGEVTGTNIYMYVFWTSSIQDMFVCNGQHIDGYLFKTKFVVNLLAYKCKYVQHMSEKNQHILSSLVLSSIHKKYLSYIRHDMYCIFIYAEIVSCSCYSWNCSAPSITPPLQSCVAACYLMVFPDDASLYELTRWRRTSN